MVKLQSFVDFRTKCARNPSRVTSSSLRWELATAIAKVTIFRYAQGEGKVGLSVNSSALILSKKSCLSLVKIGRKYKSDNNRLKLA